MTFVDDAPFGDDEPTTDAQASAVRTTHADGAVHFSELKRLNLSGKQYIHACNERRAPTPDMLIGTAVHQLVLGARPGKEIIRFDGKARKGKSWDAFAEEHEGSEILTAPEWARAEAIAAAVLADPLAQARLRDAMTEVPLEWEEDGIKFATGGVDLITSASAIGDLKTSSSVEPEWLKRQCFKMLYHCQLAFYTRGAAASGLLITGAPFLLCVETKAPHEVVELELTPELLDLGERTVALWVEKLRRYRDAGQWPGYAQSPIAWDVPEYMRADDYEDDEESP